MARIENVILVDEKDNEIGVMEKNQAHLEGKLHRAVSIFIFNSRAEMLLQQRSHTKYHSGKLWTNASCSHPRPGESNENAATRRLYEEMGLRCALTEAYSFVYRAELDNDMIEYEYDHVFIGMSDTPPVPDPTEVADWKYMETNQLKTDIENHPEVYTEWFKICIEQWHSKLFPEKSRRNSLKNDD